MVIPLMIQQLMVTSDVSMRVTKSSSYVDNNNGDELSTGVEMFDEHDQPQADGDLAGVRSRITAMMVAVALHPCGCDAAS